VIASETRGRVGLITIQRPERRNALDLEACREITAAIDDLAGAGARALVLTGSDGHFCAGADLSTVESGEFRAALRELLDTLLAAPPVIAAVEGAALGAGTQLAVSCDLRVAAADARFGIPAAKLGLMVDHWTVQRLVALVGQGPASAMLLSAEELSGTDAHRLGFVQRLGGLDDAIAWADAIADLAPLSVGGHKIALNRLDRSLNDGDVAVAMDRAWSSSDVAEGMAAFRERRRPEFRGE
jgi:enoyl-CoA hydratase/carnithine racemase